MTKNAFRVAKSQLAKQNAECTWYGMCTKYTSACQLNILCQLLPLAGSRMHNTFLYCWLLFYTCSYKVNCRHAHTQPVSVTFGEVSGVRICNGINACLSTWRPRCDRWTVGACIINLSSFPRSSWFNQLFTTNSECITEHVSCEESASLPRSYVVP